MPFPLYQGLSDDFDRHDGSLSPYVDSTNTPLPIEKHYNLRAFHTTNLSTPWTANDNTWWNGYRYPTFGAPQIGTQRSLVNVTTRGRTQTELDAMTQTQLDALNQDQIENVITSNGNEEWPSTDVDVTVGKDSAYRWSNTIQVTLASGVLKTVSSYYQDDLQTDFTFPNSDYQIELVLRAHASQADAAHLNLIESSIEISSNVNFTPGTTDTLKFIDSTNNISGTTGAFDTVARWPLASLVKSDRANIRAIRFNLKSVGSYTFIAQALRVVPNNWTSRPIGVDTKRQQLSRQVPKAGGAEGSTLFGEMFFYQTRPKNITTYTLFNSGHLPATGSDDNIIRQFYRQNMTTGDRIEVRVVSRSTQTRLFIDQKVAGVTTNLASTPTLSNILTAETDYFLYVVVNGSSVTATIYATNGNSLGSQIVTVTTTVPILTRGYVGYSFEPYFYDFSIRQISTGVADFGQFISSIFPSRTKVQGVTLYPRTSPTVNMLVDGQIEAFADATVTVSAPTYTVVRAGTSTQGGVRYNNAVWLGNTSQITVSGKIMPVSAVHGTYRIGLIDEYDSVAWIYVLSGLLPNQFNDFSIQLPTGLYPAQYYLHVQQTGSYADTFRVRDLALNHNTVGWEATIDSGSTWYAFYNAINSRWSVLRFPTSGTGLEVRATALSDHAYISGYNLVPRYIK